MRAIDEELIRSPTAFSRFQGLMGEAFLAVARGKREAALDLLERAARVPELSRQARAASRNRITGMLLRDGKGAAALAQATLALADARGRPAEYASLQLLAAAQQMVGRSAEAVKTLAQLDERASVVPLDPEKRRVRWLRGQLALARGDIAPAVEELEAAAKMLPPHAPPNGPPTMHIDLLYDAAAAFIKAGQDGKAAPLLERIQSGFERQFSPEPWARSFYLLGQISERRGDAAKARDQYERFLELWRDGDLERGWVAEAAKKVGS